VTLKPGLGSFKVIENDTIQSGTRDFLLRSIVTIGLYRTISEINDDFRRKSPILPTSRVFNATLEGFPLELGIGAGVRRN